MTARVRSRETAANAPPAEEVLRRIGGGVHVGELVYHTGLSELEVMDPLHQRERERRPQPFTCMSAGEGRARSR